MKVFDAITRRRTIRKFHQQDVGVEILKKLVDAARLAPSGANLQPIEYVIVSRRSLREKIFPCLRWAGYIAPQGNPQPDEEPMAYIIMLVNTRIKERDYQYDVGCAAENIALAAIDENLGTCLMGAIERERISQILSIPDYYIVDLVISLGYPKEEPVVEDLRESVRYYKDSRGVLHVPKRKLKEIVHVNGF